MTKMKQIMRRAALLVSAATMAVVAGTTWLGSGPALAAPATVSVSAAAAANDVDGDRPARHGKAVSGKLNINTASEEQLVLLPGVGPSKAERVVAWRSKHGTFKRVADLRHVKGFGYKTIKKLEPFLDVKGETTIKPD
jgi:competence protein ComEA